MNTEPVQQPIHLDRTGILLTTLCAVHCLTMPFLMIAAPLLIPVFLGLHKYLAWAVAPIAVMAAVRGWQKHRRADVVVLLLVGALLKAFLLTKPCSPALAARCWLSDIG
jgi:hypothetical protein